MNSREAELLNGIALAYIGDAVWELYVRDYLLDLGMTRPGLLQKEATKFVSAKAQARFVGQMEGENFLNKEELLYYRRGRNSHSKTSAKNTDVITYRISTGFEAVLGFLYLMGREDRLQAIFQFCLHHLSESSG